MNKLLSENEKKMARCLVDIAISNAVATCMLRLYLEDEEFRKKLIKRLKGGD